MKYGSGWLLGGRAVAHAVMVAIAIYIVCGAFACTAAQMRAGDADEVADAFLRMREIGVVRPSPNGRWVAIEVKRARTQGPAVLGDMDGDDRSDLWVIDLKDRRRIVVSDGRKDGSGAWAPVWSLDSRRLAFVSNRGARGIPHLEVWDEGKGTVIFKSTWGVDLEANFGSVNPYAPFGRVPFAWIGRNRILLSRTPDGHLEPGLEGDAPQEVFGPRWRAALSGGVSRTVWDSTSQAPCGSGDSLVIANIASGTQTRELDGSIRAVSVSPTRRYAVVAIAVRPFRRATNGELPSVPLYNAYTFDPAVRMTMILLALDTGKTTELYSDTPNSSVLDATAFPSWVDNAGSVLLPIVSRPDRATLMYARPGSSGGAVYVGSISQTLAMRDLLRTYLLAGTPLRTAIRQARRWLGNAAETASVGLAGVAVLQRSSVLVLNGRGMVAVRVPSKHATIEARGANDHGEGWVVLRAADDSLTLVSGEHGKVVVRREDPTDGKRIQFVYGVALRSELVVGYQLQRATGVGVVLAGGEIKTVALVNGYLNSRLLAPVRTINIGTRQQPSWARVYYPTYYRVQRTYPTILIVYPGVVFHERSDAFRFYGRSLREAVNFYSLEPYYLAALGYLVVEPSLPIVQSTRRGILDNIGWEVDGIARRLIEVRLATPGRIGVYGHSYGGYAALAAAVTSHRFAAIVASAAFADLYYYATYLPSNIRCESCAPSAALLRAYELETNPTVLNMRVPPWIAPTEYERDSAVFRATEISTPLLLIHGEFDVAPIESVEQLYLELEERGVPCRLARYWGEGHSLESPGNVFDSLHQMSAWFGRYLGASL